MTTEHSEAISKLEEDIYNLLDDFHKATGLEVREVIVRYSFELPPGKRVCLLSPDVTVYDQPGPLPAPAPALSSCAFVKRSRRP